MADTPKTPELPTEAPRPEASTRYALDTLKKGMEKIVDPADRKKADAFLARLEEVSITKLDAKEAFNNLKVRMSSAEQTDTKVLMEKMTGTGSDVVKAFDGKFGDSVKSHVNTSVKNAAEMAKDAEKALKNGDASKSLQVAEDAAKKAATAVGATVGLAGVGEIIRQAADGIMKPLKTLGDMFGEFFKMILGPFIDMFKSIWNGFTGKTEEKKEGEKKEGIVEKGKAQ